MERSLLGFMTNEMTWIFNFPFLSSNIPSAPAYDVYVSKLIRYARQLEDFIERGKLLTTRPFPRDIKEQNWCQHLKISMGDTTILSISTMWLFPELFLMFCRRQAINRHSKFQTYFSPDISQFHWFGLVGMGREPCLLCNAYFLETPGYTVSFRVHVCSSEHHYVPLTEGDGGHIAFGADPVGVREASCLHSFS